MKCGAGGKCPGQSKKPTGPIQEERKGYGKRAGKNGFHDLLRVSLTTIAILSFIFVIPSQAVSDNWLE